MIIIIKYGLESHSWRICVLNVAQKLGQRIEINK